MLEQPALAGGGHGHGNLENAAATYDTLVAKLTTDPRVKNVEAVESSHNTFVQKSISVAGKQASSPLEPTTPQKHMHVVSFRVPVLMTIVVPKRLQKQDRGESAIPSDTYHVSWDGMQFVVAWELSPEVDAHGFYGGFIALDVLRDAAKDAGVRLETPPCGPGCSYPFAHRDLAINIDTAFDVLHVRETGTRVLFASVKGEPASPVFTVLMSIASSLRLSIHTFATMRGHGEAVWMTESAARRDITKILKLQYERAARVSVGKRKRIASYWKARHAKGQSRLLVASIWLYFATLEENQAAWRDARAEYLNASTRNGVGAIFGVEYPRSVLRVEQVDLHSLRSAITYVSERADSSGVIKATLAGGIAGLVGSVAVGILTVLTAGG